MLDVRQRLDLRSGACRTYHSLPLLEVKGLAGISRLPVCLRVVLESVLRNGRRESVPLVLRIDTPIEAAYFSAGGILPYVLEQVLAAPAGLPSGASG